MEEHIGKRVNTERTEEALDTGASKIATGCPFCRVMMTDGVDEVSAARDVEKAEVLDVAQLLLGSLDTSTVTLPEKGTAAKEAEERAAKKAAEAPAKAETATVEAEPDAAPEPKAAAAAATEAESPAQPAGTKPVTGLGIAGGAKRPGAKKAAAAPAESGAAPAESKAKPAEAAPAKGLGIAAGARRPGAKKAPAKASPNEGEATVTQPPNVDPDQAKPGAKTDTADSDLGLESKPEPEVKGLGIAPGARRPGAKKAAAAPVAEPAQSKPQPEAASEPAPASESSSDGNGESAAPPVKGLGIAKGARPPGKR
jgi:hypothetical protein